MRKKKQQAEAPSEAPGATPKPQSSGLNAGRLTPMDIQKVEFGRGFKGYDEREVDEFLDRLTEDFAAALDESQRLRDRVDSGLGAVGTSAPDVADADRQAEQILQRARSEAAQIVRAAETRAAGAGGMPAATGADRAAVMSFLNTEREFLKDLAGLVQGHVDNVKGMASSSLKPAPGSAPASASPGAAAAPKPAASAPPAAGATSPAKPAPPASSSAAKSPQPTSAAPGETQPMPTVNVPDSPEARPAPAKRGGPAAAPAESAEKTDGSLRELFWGED